jgi:SNF2 family DNA or RNA helicase
MGLGKTLQGLCAIQGRTLVIAPTSVLRNWEKETLRFRPGLSVCVYHGPKRSLSPDADLVITSYGLLRLDIELLRAERWDMAILDEAQAIKNPDSQVARAAFQLDAGFRLTLTGTPVENRLDELWSQLNFVNPGLLGSRKGFQERYAKPISQGQAGVASELRARIRPFLLRRLKREVAPELPPKIETVLYVTLTEDERAAYDAVRATTQKEIVAQLGHGANPIQALAALMRLRQAACHKGLLPKQHADTSSKVQLLIETLDSVIAQGHKALVFSQWTSLLDRVEPHLEAANVPYIRLDGSTRDRAGVVDAFQSDDGPPLMLISLKAGGTGLNLTAADHVFLMDPWWNPAVEDQAADRAHRIGQDRPVIVTRLVTLETVEERILALQSRKRALADAALAGADRAAALTRDDLLALLA